MDGESAGKVLDTNLSLSAGTYIGQLNLLKTEEEVQLESTRTDSQK